MQGANLVPAPVICGSSGVWGCVGGGGAGCLTQLLNPAAALAAPGSILGELAENKGLPAGRLLVPSRCLKGGPQSFLVVRLGTRVRALWQTLET